MRHPYSVLYDVRVSPSERSALVKIEIGQGAQNVIRLRFTIDPERHTELAADGELVVDGNKATWRPPASGGSFRYRFRIDHLRNERSYDGRMASTWALFRGDDLVPPVHSTVEDGAYSRARLRLRLPASWSAAVPFSRYTTGDYRVEQSHRRLDRPVGWFLLGEIGVVREEIEGMRVAIAGPIKHGVHRLDLLALLRWTLPELRKITPSLPERLLVVSAGDPMWRGGLSGPGSLYLHASRPLISDDGTSPMLHELVHAVTSARAEDLDDELVEGLAEYYSLQMLARSGTLSPARVDGAWARARGRPRGDRSAGAGADRGMLILRELDEELRDESGGKHSLDTVMAGLIGHSTPISIAQFNALVLRTTGYDPADFLAAHGWKVAAPDASE